MQHAVGNEGLIRRVNGGKPLPPTRVMAVSETRLLRDAFADILGCRRQFSITDVGGVPEAMRRIAAARPDIVLIDFSSSGSLALAREIAERDPDIKVVAFGVGELDDDIVGCAIAGIAAFVPPSASAEELVDALEGAMRGELVCSPRLAARLYRRLGALATTRTAGDFFSTLTPRELEIAQMIGAGMSNKEIATELRIRSATVKNHVHNILGKLQIERRGQILRKLRNVAQDNGHVRDVKAAFYGN